ncbi:MAG: sulfatase-like hydrolase/transferase [bacterium]|nr:sulfatase-like hydrolase/transferase [bacterium]
MGTGLATAALLLALTACGRSEPWNVLLVSFDTTRADAIGCYGNEAIATPTLDALAAEGVLFQHAYSAVPITQPSHTTILTGKYPIAHGVRDNGLFVLAPEHQTMAELLAAHGYATAAAVGSFPLVAKFGLDQGFELYDDKLNSRNEDYLGRGLRQPVRLFFDERRAAWVNDAVIPWLEEHRDEPFFLWVHYFDPHQPFEPPPPYDELYANDLYAGEIAYADESLGTLLDHLRRLGVFERTLIVFTADHGEGRGEHGEVTHSYLTYDTTLHVPLIFRLPEGPRSVTVEPRVVTADILPTVLELLGLPIPPDLDGRSLAGHLRGSASPPPAHYAETLAPRLANNWGELRVLYDGPWKYIHGPRPELYDLESDPGELTDLIASEPETAAELRGRLAAFVAAHAPDDPVAPVAPDPETRRRLMALGYIQGTGEAATAIREELRDDGTPPQDRVGDTSTLSTAKNLLLQGRALGARDLARRLVDEDPQNRFYLELLAYAEAQLGNMAEALEILDRLLRSGPASGSPETLLARIGRYLYLNGEKEEGLRAIRESVELNATASGFYLLATVLGGMDQSEAAREALRQSLEIDPTYAPARVDLAIHLAQGDERAAAAEFERALSDQPYFAKAHYNYGTFLVQTGRIEEALERFRRAVALDPGYLKAYQAVIALELSRGRTPEAEQMLARLVARAPGSREAQLARELVEKNR